MSFRKYSHTGIAALLLALVSTAGAKSPEADGEQRIYAVVLQADSVAEWHARRIEREAASLQSDGNPKAARITRRPDFASTATQAHLRKLDEDFEDFRVNARQVLGRDVVERRRFRNSLNGFSTKLTPAEAATLSGLPDVKSVLPIHDYKPNTDAGPPWIGADDLWNGAGGKPASRGEGVVIGIVDSGINWDHISFSDPGGVGGHDFINPLGSQKGLCSDPEVKCNDKLIGVYDFVEDDPDTAVNDYTKGFDDSGHGTHVASIAAGNTLAVTNNGLPMTLSGVAPNANIIVYRVCYDGDPDDSEDGSCSGEAIIDALNQALADGVDVINYSLGTDAFSPWNGATPVAMLNLFNAGIVAVTSASNDGPSPSTIGSPANAPWIMGVGNATHNRTFASLLENMTGGDTPAPDDMVGASLTATSGFRKIVHAKDFGNALCGAGTEELGSACNDNTGATNPFPPGTFNGEIVVCDRGQYGRIEKGKNVQLAGAGGMILANTAAQGESLNADEHCLPAIHIGQSDGDVLRQWLDSGSNHMGTISGFDRILTDSVADQVATSSSRGPSEPPVQNVLKPNVIAPGQNIIGAWLSGNSFNSISGTSMASPHVAGAAALLLSINSSWTPSQVSSALEMTSTAELAKDFDNSVATPHERGAGRPRLADAANAGLYLNETGARFTNANPNIGGNPGNLNLSGLLDPDCMGSCSFTRTVTGIVGGKSWSTSASGFPAGVNVSVSPSSFTLGAGASRQLTITVDLGNAPVIGNWVYGDVILSAAGVPDAKFTVAVFANGGDLPTEWNISSASNGGSRQFSLSGLADMPQATFSTGGLVRPELDTQILGQDPTRDDPYDGGAGVLTKLLEVPVNALWLHTETLQSDANDIDLFVGRDTNGDGEAELSEEICSSTTPEDLELCDILNPVPGTYWVIAQNWESNGANDPVHLETAVITSMTGTLNATGPGIVPPGDQFDVQVAWNDVDAIEGELLLGAVGVGTHTDRPGNIGVIPVYFNRNSIGAPASLALFDGRDQSLALGGNSTHNLAFIDIPPGADQLSVTASAQSAGLNNSLAIELRRMDFSMAFSAAPQALPSPGGAAIAAASGSGGNGPQLTVNGTTLQPGRWYVDLVNSNAQSASVTVRADVSFSGQPVPVKGQLWISENRPGISQGIDYQPISTSHGLLWYTFANNHDPAWYLAAGAAPSGNIWSSDLLRFTNDGAVQQFETVGRVAMTMLDVDDAIFSWSLFGESGSERMNIIAGEVNNCPTLNDQLTSVSGFWGKAQAGLGGASVLFLDNAHAEIHYLYDALGRPVWLQAAGGEDDLTLTQFSGNCPTCANEPISSQDVGLLGHDYQSESAAQWDFDYLLSAPLTGDIERVDNDVIKLSDIRVCE